jgi:hypothetical protein
MPLTYLVEHLNQRLQALHPDAILAGNSRIEYRDQVVTANINGLSVTPVQSLVFKIKNPALIAKDSRLLIRNKAGETLPQQLLYLQAWNSADIIFLDRLLRTLHSLHHVNQAADGLPQDQLILDVHSRHLTSVPSGHGLVFESLLKSLGLSPEQIILRLTPPTTADQDSFGQAIENFCARGYRLLLELDRPDSEWLLHAVRLGISYIAVNGTREQLSDFSNLVRWNDQARRLGLQTLLTDVADTQTLNAAISQGYELVEGPVLMALSKGDPVAARRVGRLPLQAHDIPLSDWML